MILQALNRQFEDLRRQGKVPDYGWAPMGISFALCLDTREPLERAGAGISI